MGKAKSFNKKRDVLITSILIMILYFIWPYLIEAVLVPINLDEDLSLCCMFIGNFILFIIIIYTYYKDFLVSFKDLKKNKKKLLVGLKIFIIGLVLYIGLNAVLKVFVNLEQDNTNAMLNVYSKIPILFVLASMFYYPVIEEIVFKKSFKEFITNKWLFVFVTGFITAFFTLALSLNSITSLLYFIPIAIFSMTFSYIYYITDNILVAIFYRILYNVIPSLVALIYGVSILL
ncbi:MAG: CPBP family glutamic-type intramembrane protease [bacterium]|nr:CPBP family glutamic-type intramembrane protease [bacterium]